MPVPISAQVYTPNPALGPQSYARGAEVGQSTSPFASFVSGAFKGAQATANIMDTLQQIEYRPQEMEIQKRAADRADKAEIRQQGAEDFNQRYDTERLGLEKEKFNFDKNIETEKLLIQKNNMAVARSGQASKTEAEGAIAQALGQGDFSGIQAIQNDPTKKDTLYTLMDKLAEPNGYGPAMSKRIQEYVTSGQARPEEVAALQQFGENIGYATDSKRANKYAPNETQWIQAIGVAPNPRYDILTEDVMDSTGVPIGKDVYQLVPGEGKHRVGRYLSDADPQKNQKFENAVSAHQYQVDTQRRMRDQIMGRQVDKAAELEQSSRSPAPEDAPAKISKEQAKSGFTPSKRVGVGVTTITNFPEVSQVEKEKARQRETRPNAQRAKEKLKTSINPRFSKDTVMGNPLAPNPFPPDA